MTPMCTKPDGLGGVTSLAAKALANGAERVSQMRVKWNLAKECDHPGSFKRYGAPTSDREGYVTVAPGTSHPIEVEIITPCRKCNKCLDMRSRVWAARAMAEIEASSRTWFGTLTLSPERHHQALSAVRGRSDERLADFDNAKDANRFAQVTSEIGKEITRWIKRVRKNSGAGVRYCLVAEQHKSGLPHFHVLIHERSLPVRHAILKEAWTWGFTNFKLVTNGKGAAWYVAKYLSKSSVARVRASLNYGEGSTEPIDLNHLNDLLANQGEPRDEVSRVSFGHVQTQSLGTPLTFCLSPNPREGQKTNSLE